MAARQNPTRKKSEGPFLAAAVFCDRVIVGNDGTVSAIRIVDRVTVTVSANAPPDTPSEKNRVPLLVHVLVSFRTGYAKRKHKVHLVGHSPSGKKHVTPAKTLEFGKEPNSGANLNIDLNMMVAKGGLFWWDVMLDDKVVTRMPLNITVQRASEDSPTEANNKRPSKTGARSRR